MTDSKSSPPLATVSVPEPFRHIFRRAQEYVAQYFSDRVEDPAHSTISISGERYILVRAASMSVEFFDHVISLYQDKGADAARAVAKNLLFDVAHTIGKADAKAFHARMHVTDPIERLSAGPVHFSYAGWAFVEILPESSPTPDEHFYLLYNHPYSFESSSWLRRGRRADFPVCVMNTGYSSGWCEESFGVPLVAAEVECMAMGDAQCRFIMAPPGRIEEHLARYLEQSATGHVRARWARSHGPVEVPEFFQRKRLEEALRASHDALEERVRERTAELELANDALRHEMAERQRTEEERRRLEAQMREAQKLESLGVLAGGIAHDFNNLLVGILGNAGVVLRELPGESQVSRTVRDIETSALRASELVRQMLAYSGRGRFEREPFDLSEMVAEMTQLLTTAISKKASLDFDFAPRNCRVEGDPTQLRQVVMNLLTNASDALEARAGAIKVRTSIEHVDAATLAASVLDDGLTPGPYARLEVTDTGVGMDDATKSKVFEPFFTTKFTGRGLGLAAVLGIVRAHRGAIQVESAPGRGTTFRVYLPHVPRAERTPIEPLRAAPAAAVATGTVLVADDEKVVRDVVTRVLKHAGFTVVTAVDGLDAMERYEEHQAEIVAAVLDVTMPNEGGIETLAKLRARRPDLPIVLSSGYAEEDPTQPFSTVRYDAFLHKPFRPQDLLDAIRSVIK